MEDFVPFELAVKLKEKGFNQPCMNAINARGCTYKNGWCEYLDDRCDEFIHITDLKETDYLLPTISQVLKWLREEKDMYISVFIDDDSDTPVTYEIYKDIECVCTHQGEYFTLKDWNKCELRAIEYTLDNLI